MKKFLIVCMLLTHELIAVKEYLYPVGACTTEHEVCIYLLHQVGDQKLELFAWDPITKIARSALLSTYTPAGFTLLPHGKGFSINDNGRIRIKSPTKRSPKSIQFYPPVHDVSTINWNEDGESFYFMATKGNKFGIFESDLQGNVAEIVLTPQDDYMYPQRIGNALFMIKRTSEKNYAIVTGSYPEKMKRESDVGDYQEQLAHLLNGQELSSSSIINPDEIKEILALGSQPIVFLHMLNEQRGFYLAHPATIESHDKVIPFTAYEIAKDNEGIWKERPLFNFALPAYFFMAATHMRLYESLLPLLPRYTQDSIYYVDCEGDTLKTSIYTYECNSGTRARISHALTPSLIGESFFAPLALNSLVFYGGSMSTDETMDVSAQQPTMWLNEDGVLCADLPVAVALSKDCTNCLKQSFTASK